MSLIVQKFGGTSVGTAERINNVARRVAETHKQGNDVVVVVSAMGKGTDDLIALANDVSSFDGVDSSLEFIEIHRQRFFAVHIFACIGSCLQVPRMLVVTRCDHHGIDVLQFQ